MNKTRRRQRKLLKRHHQAEEREKSRQANANRKPVEKKSAKVSSVPPISQARPAMALASTLPAPASEPPVASAKKTASKAPSKAPSKPRVKAATKVASEPKIKAAAESKPRPSRAKKSVAKEA